MERERKGGRWRKVVESGRRWRKMGRRHRAGAGLILGKFSQSFLHCLYDFKSVVIINITGLFVNGNSNYIQGF